MDIISMYFREIINKKNDENGRKKVNQFKSFNLNFFCIKIFDFLFLFLNRSDINKY